MTYYIGSLTRKTSTSAWDIALLEGSTNQQRVRLDGGVAIGPRLRSFIQQAEDLTLRYPVTILFHHIPDNRILQTRVVGNQIGYIEVPISTFKTLSQARFMYEDTVVEPVLKSSATKRPQGVTAPVSIQNIDEALDLDRKWYMAICKVLTVEDGDTIRVKMAMPEGYDKSMWAVKWELNNIHDKEITIRFQGCDTPESIDNGEYDEKKNSKMARYYHISLDEMGKVGKEASLFTRQMLGASNDGKGGSALAVVHLDCTADGDPIVDPYGRYVGEVYATNDSQAQSVWQKMSNGTAFVNMNKTLLTTKSKGAETSHVPLGSLYYGFVMEDEGTIGIIGWPSELGLEALNYETHLDPSLTPDFDRDMSMTAPRGNSFEVKTTSIYDNTNKWLTPYDDREEEFLDGFPDNPEDLHGFSRTRIGDVILQVPPTAIQISTTSNIRQIKTMRTKSSMKFNNGHSFTVLKMNLYFHDLDSINGRPVPWKKDSDKVFYIDGLRSLLAQFSKCPFLPIDNYYINHVLGIDSVALQNINISTVPDFPESLQAELTLVEFNHEPVVFAESLGSIINYPLMRWYYQEAMTNRGPHYRYFKGIDEEYSSHFTFQIADEDYLHARKDAATALNKLDNPKNYEDSLKKNESIKGKKEDRNSIQEILDLRSLYLTAVKPHLKSYSVIDSYTDPWILSYLVKNYGSHLDTKQILSDGQDHYEVLYGGKNKRKLLEQSFTFIPWETYTFYENRFSINKDLQSLHGIDVSKYTQSEMHEGMMVLSKLKASANQKLLTKYFAQYYSTKHKRYFVPATESNLKKVKEIQAGYDDAMSTFTAQKKHYNDLIEFLNTGESHVPMVDVEIQGTLILTQVNAILENQFAMLSVSNTAKPTLQYMGGGEASTEMVFEADQDGVQSFVNMLKKADQLSIEYKEGITNGFLSIKNDLANLIGIRHVMVSNYQVSTVAGFPGRFTIKATVVEFDVTQRKREELKGIPGMTKDMNLDDLEGMKGQLLNDRVLEARLHELEVYPDLELPTYKEVNEALPELDAKLTEYENPTGAVFVDPDFYFSHAETVRQMVESSYVDESLSQLNMFDSTGVAAFTNHKQDIALNSTKEMRELLSEQDKKATKTESSKFKWSADDSNGAPSLDQIPVDKENNKPTYFPANDVTREFFWKTNKDGTPLHSVFPTRIEWYREFGSDTEYDYEDFVDKKNPTEGEVYNELKKLVDHYFGDIVIRSDWLKKWSEATGVEKRTAYASPNAFYAAIFQIIKKQKINTSSEGINYGGGANKRSYELPNSLIRELKKRIVRESEVVFDTNSNTLTYSDGTALPKNYVIEPSIDNDEVDPSKLLGVFHERIMALLKAFLDATSNWTHWTGDGPIVSEDRERVGIAAVPIRIMPPKEAKKVLWNWKYNLKVAISLLRGWYDAAAVPIEKEKDLERFEAFCRPQDAMFAGYYLNRLPKTVREMDTHLFNMVMKQFNKYAYKPFDTFSGTNKDVYASYLNPKSKLTATIRAKTKKDREKMISLLLNDLVYRNKQAVLDKGHEWKGTQDKLRKEIAKEFLEKQTSEALQGLVYERAEYLVAFYKKHAHEGRTVIKDECDFYITSAIEKQAKKLIESKKEYAEQVTISRLINNDSPQLTYEKMWYDLRKYDMRGRMARAFPSFQMFIIHEGAWMAEYKFFDNMYGFNAIESIDVYRSRKIAADTAVIRMSNVYSSLTTKHTDIDMMQGDLKFWENMVFNHPPKEVVEAKKRIPKTLYVQPGARVHLRMGYGSNVRELPVVFNGTITEMNADTVVEFVCQGDGIELGNVISGDPDDNNKGVLSITEPRDVICKLMGSKGSWLKNMMYNVSGGELMKENPLGIAHFGLPYNELEGGNNLPLGYTFAMFNNDFGEVAQNIYSTNGTPTYGQWLWPNGTNRDIFSDFSWSSFFKHGLQPGDEANLVLKYYNNTVWDVIQTIALCTPDYIATPFPYELRSSLFFGKPYWNCSFGYDSEYIWDATQKTWIRYIRQETRRPYMQYKFYTSSMDILHNGIRVQDENVFTNVIVTYDGKTTPVIYADSDIRYDRQKTRVVEADIMQRGAGVNYWTAEVQATNYGASVLRHSMMDMYQGYLTVIGDPSVKPYDMAHLTDEVNEMTGAFGVKAVTHSLSFETGFITQIEPDCLAVNDDTMLDSLGSWFTSAATSIAGRVIVLTGTAKTLRWLGGKWMHWMPVIGKTSGLNAVSHMLEKMTLTMDKTDPDVIKVQQMLKDLRAAKTIPKKQMAFEQIGKLMDTIHKKEMATLKGKKGAKTLSKKVGKFLLGNFGKLAADAVSKDKFADAAKFLMKGGRGLISLNPIGLIANVVIFIATETLLEKYRRFKENQQSVMCMPLTYRGSPLFAGLWGHAGLVKGDPPGRMDKIWAAESGNKWIDVPIWFANVLSGHDEDIDSDQYSAVRNEMTNMGKSN
jgi:endonuclease YncB( thermonuclease family)